MERLFNIKGIKCDNPNCNFVDMSVSFESYKHYVNALCPYCGQNLLTSNCYRRTLFIVRVAKFIDTLHLLIFPKSYKRKLENADKEICLNINAEGRIDVIFEEDL